jgi:hypothetical protein
MKHSEKEYFSKQIRKKTGHELLLLEVFVIFEEVAETGSEDTCVCVFCDDGEMFF